MRLLRWNTIVHLCASLILAWTAVDLLVPKLCAAETFTVSTEASHDADDSPVQPDSDCFCCSHTVTPMSCDAVLGVIMIVGSATFPTSELPLGVSRLLYHPPLKA